MITMPKTFRNVTIRISALNHATKDNEVLGIKAGDEVRYLLCYSLVMKGYFCKEIKMQEKSLIARENGK